MDRRYDETVDDRSFEEKAKRFLYDCGEKARSVGKWAKENPQLAVSLSVAAVGALAGIAKAEARKAETKEIRQRREKSIYDRSLGHYYDLNRKPKPKEWAEIDQRKENGESYGSILRDMNLI